MRWLWLLCAAGCRLDFAPVPQATCPPSAMFCDDFASGDLSRWSLTSVTPGAQLAVQDAMAHEGFALEGDVPAIMNGSIAAAITDFPSTSTGMLAAREWVYAPAPLVHFDAVLSVRGASNQYTILGANDHGAWTVTERSVGATTTYDHAAPVGAASNAWVCVELDYDFDAHHVTLWVDDALALDTAMVDPAPVYDKLSAGVPRADAAGAQAIVDDVALGTEHLGCE